MSVKGRKPTSLIGSYLRQKRELRNISQKQLGLQFNPAVTTQFISNLERGVTPLPTHHIPTLARALEVSESEFLALLERAYTEKINSKLRRPTQDLNNVSIPTLKSVFVQEKDAQLFQALYEAYTNADSETKQKWSKECERLLGMTK